MALRSREQLKKYCLRNLGHDVIEINISEDQMEDRIDDALQFFSEYHFDGTERIYLKYIITQTDIDNGYIDLVSTNSFNGQETQAITESGLTGSVPIENTITSVLQVFHFSQSSISMFDIRYQYVLNDLYTMGAINLPHYFITQEYLTLLRQMLSPDKQIRFNRRNNRLYIDTKMNREITAGNYIIIEAFRVVDASVSTEIYEDMLLKKYTTALFKRQWGANLLKFQGIQLPGNITFNGQEIFNQAIMEIQEMENTILSKWSLPPDFFVG